MRASELRVGNWVMYSYMITVNGYKIAECEDHPSRFSAVPLTEKWLLKFGFEKVTYHHEDHLDDIEYHLKVNDDVFMCYCDDFSVGLYASKKDMYDTISVIPEKKSVDTVHGLQNLYFALSGKELEIKK